MKKLLISMLSMTLVVGIFSCALASEYTKFSKKFIKNFRDCDVYEETINSTFEDKTFTTHRKILGYKNGFCRYQSTVKSSDGTYRLNCAFAPAQVDDLYEAMKDRSKNPEEYTLELFAPSKDAKTGATKYVRAGTTMIKGNKAYVVWAKYENNPYFCKPEKL